jgi:hypothetical protein
VVRGVLSCDPRGVSEETVAKIVSHIERMKNNSTHFCAKTAFVGLPSTESKRITSFRYPSIIILENTLNYCTENTWLCQLKLPV